MTVTIHITPPRFRQIAKGIPEAIKDQMVVAAQETARFGLTAVQRAINATRPPPVATGNYRNSWKVITSEDGAQLVNTAKHAKFVEFGRRPGKRPPLKPIEQWVRVKRLSSNPREIRSIAFAIARKIGREGTKPRLVLERVKPVMQKFFLRELKRSMDAVKPPR